MMTEAEIPDPDLTHLTGVEYKKLKEIIYAEFDKTITGSLPEKNIISYLENVLLSIPNYTFLLPENIETMMVGMIEDSAVQTAVFSVTNSLSMELSLINNGHRRLIETIACGFSKSFINSDLTVLPKPLVDKISHNHEDVVNVLIANFWLCSLWLYHQFDTGGA